MNKTVTITMNGQLFYVEEPAFKKLESYLQSIQKYFAHHEDKEEIISDIESRIAEQFSEKTSKLKRAISLQDVEALIQSMGTIEDFKEFEKQENPEQIPQTTYKKLYRNPDDKIIAGVASGLAAYLKINPIIIRLIFLISIFAGGFGVVLYILLWILIPEAKTPTQKIEMQGEPVTLSNIEEELKFLASNLKDKDSKIRGILENSIQIFFDFIRKILSVFYNILKKLFSIFIKIFALLGSFFSAFMLLLITFAFLFLLFNIADQYGDNLLKTFIGNLNYYTLLISGFLLFATTLIAIILGCFSILKKKNIFTEKKIISIATFWLASILVFVLMSFNSLPLFIHQYQIYTTNYYQNTKTFSISDMSDLVVMGNLKVRITQGTQESIVAHGPEKELQNLKLTEENGKITITNPPTFKICAFCFSKPIFLEITTPELASLSLSSSNAIIQNFDQTTLTLKLDHGSSLFGELTTDRLITESNPTSVLFLKGTGKILEIKGNGYVHALDFPVEEAIVDLKSQGGAEINVSKKLMITEQANGAAISYSGNPSIETQNFIGRLEKLTSEQVLDIRSSFIWFYQSRFDELPSVSED